MSRWLLEHSLGMTPIADVIAQHEGGHQQFREDVRENLHGLPLVCVDGHCAFMDTIVEQMPESIFPDLPWGPGNHPITACTAFLGENDHFVVDRDIDATWLISVAPSGYLRRML